METRTLHGAPPATLTILLDDPDEHDFPSAGRLLDGLSAAQALCRPSGLSTSIAEIVAPNAAYHLGQIATLRRWIAIP